MKTPEPVRTSETPLSQDLIYALRYYLGGRRGLLMLAGAAAAGGLVLNWNWLVAIGLAPLLIAALPCVAMCALGLCMNRMIGGSCAPEEPSRASAQPDVETSAELNSIALPVPVQAEATEPLLVKTEATETTDEDTDSAPAGADDPTVTDGLTATTIERS